MRPSRFFDFLSKPMLDWFERGNSKQMVASLVGLVSMSSFVMCQNPVSDNPIRLASDATIRKATEISDFQIRVDIYSDENRPPNATLQTYFTKRMYIELDDQNNRCTVVDPVKGRVTLLDTKRKSLVHLEMTTIETQLSRALELMSEQQLALFRADGQIRQEADGYYSIGNNMMRYWYLPLSTHADIATSYGDFTNWVCRVKALYPPKMPPQMRLTLNEMLMDQSQIPAVVRRQIVYNGKSEELVARLIVTKSLTDVDRSRIADVFQWLNQYSVITDSEFFK
jgi:hypothetical protein